MAERPTPERTARCSKRSSLIGGRGVGRFGHLLRGVGRTGRFEQRQPHVLALFEANDHLLPDVDVVRVATDDVRGEVDGRVLGQGDDRDRVRRLEVRQPLMAVDRERDDGRVPGDLRW